MERAIIFGGVKDAKMMTSALAQSVQLSVHPTVPYDRYDSQLRQKVKQVQWE